MKKNLKKLKQPHIWRAALRMTIIRGIACLIPVLLWNHFRNPLGLTLTHGLSVMGVISAAFAWFYYLALDGFSPFPSSRASNALPRMTKRRNGGMLDHVDHVPDGIDTQLERDEIFLCRHVAYLAVAILYQVPSFAAYIL